MKPQGLISQNMSSGTHGYLSFMTGAIMKTADYQASQCETDFKAALNPPLTLEVEYFPLWKFKIVGVKLVLVNLKMTGYQYNFPFSSYHRFIRACNHSQPPPPPPPLPPKQPHTCPDCEMEKYLKFISVGIPDVLAGGISSHARNTLDLFFPI